MQPLTYPCSNCAHVHLSTDAFMGVQYQTRTHFQFGNDKEPPASIYANGTHTAAQLFHYSFNCILLLQIMGLRE